jgi:predicted MPP superfamily phosphohydrolase
VSDRPQDQAARRPRRAALVLHGWQIHRPADPWCLEGAATAYADPLALTHHVVPGAAHLALDDGYGAWDAPIRWCSDPEGGWPRD